MFTSLFKSTSYLSIGTILDHHHCLLHISLMDKCGNICVTPFNFWRDSNSPNPNVDRTNISNLNVESSTKQSVVIATEKQVKVRCLPSFKTMYSVEPVTGDAFIVKAETMMLDGWLFKSLFTLYCICVLEELFAQLLSALRVNDCPRIVLNGSLVLSIEKLHYIISASIVLRIHHCIVEQ